MYCDSRQVVQSTFPTSALLLLLFSGEVIFLSCISANFGVWFLASANKAQHLTEIFFPRPSPVVLHARVDTMAYTCQLMSLQPTISALKILKDGVPLQFDEDKDIDVIVVETLQTDTCRIVMVIIKKQIGFTCTKARFRG